MTYKFTVEDKDGEMIYTITAPTQEMLEEKMGAYERHVKEGMKRMDSEQDAELATAQIRVYPSTRKKLNILAAQQETTIAEVVEELL